MKEGNVTLEFLSIVVRLHKKPTTFGEFAPYDDGFILHQIGANIYEAKLASSIEMKPSHQRELVIKMVSLGAKRVDLWRHKEGEEPYKISIHADGKITRTDASE